MSTAKKIVLIVTTGSQDVKFWVKHTDDTGSRCLDSIPVIKRASKRVHDWLLNTTDRWDWRALDEWGDNAPAFASCQGVQVGHDAGRDVLALNIDQEVAKPENSNPELCDGNERGYCLRPAKLDRLLSAVKHDPEPTREPLEVAGVLVFGTDRRQEDEPVASHHLIAGWIAGYLFNDPKASARFDRLENPPEKPIWFVNAAQDICNRDTKKDKTLEGTGDDYPLRREVVWRIDQSIQAFCTRYADAVPLVIQTGGPGEIKSLVSASATLRSGGAAREINITEKAGLEEAEALIGEIRKQLGAPVKHLHSAERLMARHLAMERIRRGDFEGAWAVCAHLNPEPPQNRWVIAVKWVRDYFKESRSPKADRQSGPPDPNTELSPLVKRLHSLLVELTRHDSVEQQIRRALTQTAFRIEAALTAPREEDLRIEEALATTGTFNDLLLRASIWQNILQDEKFDNLESFGDDKLTGKGEAPPIECTTKSGKEVSMAVIDAKGGRLLKVVGPVRDAWRAKLNDRLKGEHLSNRFQKRWELPCKDDGTALSRYRNLLAHQMLETKHRNGIRESAACAGKKGMRPLWSPSLVGNQPHIKPGAAFLLSSWIEEVQTQFDYKFELSEKYVELTWLLREIVTAPVPCP